MCDYYVNLLYAGRFGLGWAYDVFKFACHMFMHFHAYVPSSLYILIYWCCLVLFCSSLSLSLSLFLALVCSMASKRKSTPSHNPLRSGASTSSSDPTPSHLWFRDDKARKDFSENFSQQGIHLECQVILSNFFDTDLPIVICSRGWGSLCDISVTCPSMIIQEFYSNMHWFDTSVPHFFSHVWGTRIVVTPDIVSEVLHVPRVMHLDYPSCNHLGTVSKDELSSLFCETPSSWGDHQNTPYSGFAKGPRFLNMVMTFILHPLSHYNSITEPRARFLLSLLEDISIDFPSHFILSLIDVYKDTTTRDKLIFHLAITWMLHHFSVLFPESPYFTVMSAIDAATVQPRWPRTETVTPPASIAPSTSTPSSFASWMTLEAFVA